MVSNSPPGHGFLRLSDKEKALHQLLAIVFHGRLFLKRIEVAHKSWGITLLQHKHASDLLHRVHMENCKSVSTLMSVTNKLARDSGTFLSNDDTIQI
ncbi:hypothetical protein Tco_0670326 [Tanacetum coccineum]